MTSLDECMQAKIMHAHSLYLGIDDFGSPILIVDTFDTRVQQVFVWL